MAASRLVLALTVALLAATGCTDVVGGVAVPADAGGPDGLLSGELAATLLSVEEINSIMGADDIEMVDSSESMLDHSGDVSDPSCLGSLYNAEERVYRDSGWSEVVDEVLTQPRGESVQWVEQTAVRFPSAADASSFYDDAKAQWEQCGDRDLSVFDGEHVFTWEFEPISVAGTTLSQSAQQLDSDGWTCQHALSAAGDVVVEASACSMNLRDEAVTIVEALVKNVG
ncbi:sensor domain-containing protein [Mycolicibacterium mengxianglii]|uniref:sensor domain-containing protein n=1 Tax=Mycolicibacterium mengxianglii TaxID=2736649 RepID=UPI0018EEE565|nr:sensor domain-containing protein [Mycolicibacterium mengxianglii]